MNHTALLAVVAVVLACASRPSGECRAAERTQTSLEISGMVTGFAPDAASGVMYPSELAGPVYSIENGKRDPAGWYSEQTQFPIVAPGMNPLGFIGSVGLSTFTFEQDGAVVGTLQTLSVARLVVENEAGCKTDFAKGILCVQADGIVIEATGIYRHAAGSFKTQSMLNLGLLSLETKLELTLWVKSPPATGQVAAAASCCRPAHNMVQEVASPAATDCCDDARHDCGQAGGGQTGGWLTGGCTLLTSPLRCVFR